MTLLPMLPNNADVDVVANVGVVADVNVVADQ